MRAGLMLLLGAAPLAAACADDGGGTGGGTAVTPEERGAERFADTSLGRVGNLVACNDCHATPGESETRLATGAPMGGVTGRPSFWGGQEDDLLRSVNQCLYWFMGRSEPLVAGDPEGDDLYAYVASLEGDVAAQPFTIGNVVWPGTGDAARGEVVYARACATCHGDKDSGEGALIPSAPVLPEETLAAHPDPEYDAEDRRLVFVEKVRHGPFLGYGGTMPPFSVEVLPDAELADLFTYLGIP